MSLPFCIWYFRVLQVSCYCCFFSFAMAEHHVLEPHSAKLAAEPVVVDFWLLWRTNMLQKLGVQHCKLNTWRCYKPAEQHWTLLPPRRTTLQGWLPLYFYVEKPDIFLNIYCSEQVDMEFIIALAWAGFKCWNFFDRARVLHTHRKNYEGLHFCNKSGKQICHIHTFFWCMVHPCVGFRRNQVFDIVLLNSNKLVRLHLLFSSGFWNRRS